MMAAERNPDEAPETEATEAERKENDFSARRRMPFEPIRGPFSGGGKGVLVWLYVAAAAAMTGLFVARTVQGGMPPLTSMLWVLPVGALYFIVRALMVARPRLR